MLIHFIHGYYCIYRPWQPLKYLYFSYHCISLIDFSFTMIRMFLYAQIYWLAEFGDVSCLQCNYLRVETLTPTWDTLTLTPTWEDFVGRFCRTILRVTLSKSPTKLCVRPESMIVDTLGGICTFLIYYLPLSISPYYSCSVYWTRYQSNIITIWN
jgi:hypothetical protein